jgi:hypothetical protein
MRILITGRVGVHRSKSGGTARFRIRAVRANARCRALKGLPILLRRNIVLELRYVKDWVKITSWFIGL